MKWGRWTQPPMFPHNRLTCKGLFDVDIERGENVAYAELPVTCPWKGKVCRKCGTILD